MSSSGLIQADDDDGADLMMEPVGSQGNSVMERRKPIVFGLNRCLTTLTNRFFIPLFSFTRLLICLDSCKKSSVKMCFLFFHRLFSPIAGLTKGHTHMSADGIHGNIDKQMRKTNVYDFHDLTETIEKSRKNIKLVVVEQFRAWQKKKRQPRKDKDDLKDFNLKDVVEVKFERGSRQLKYKKSFLDLEYQNLTFCNHVSILPRLLKQ